MYFLGIWILYLKSIASNFMIAIGKRLRLRRFPVTYNCFSKLAGLIDETELFAKSLPFLVTM